MVKLGKHKGAIAGAGVLIVIVSAWYLGYFAFLFPSQPAQSVLFKGSITDLPGNSPYGTVEFITPAGMKQGSGALSSGTFTTGVIMTDADYYEFFNGTGVTWGQSWLIHINKVSGVDQPANYYVSINATVVRPIATTYTDQITDGTTTASESNGGSTQTTAFTATHAVAKTYTYMVTVTDDYSLRDAAWYNPHYPASGSVQGWAWFETNSTTAYLASGSAGTVISLASTTIFIVPLPECQADATAKSISASISIIWPSAGHFTFKWTNIWNTNLVQMQNAKSQTAPTGYTVGTFYIENGVLTVS